MCAFTGTKWGQLVHSYKSSYGFLRFSETNLPLSFCGDMIHLDGYLHNHLGNKPSGFCLSYFSYCKYLVISNLREKEFTQIDNSIEGGEDMAAGEEGMPIEARGWLVKLHLHSRSSDITGNGVRLEGSIKAPPTKRSTTFRKKATGLELGVPSGEPVEDILHSNSIASI